MDAAPNAFPAADARLRMQDPRTQYPQPPFPEQPQAAPGLARAMDPKPDHGETSYKGHGRLEGRKALVTGGDSGIGRAAAIAFAREGADVAIVYEPDEEADAQEVIKLIEADGRKALALPGDIKDEAFCKQIVADTVKAFGGLDILVNNAGKQTTQPTIADITSEQFDATFKTNVYAMFWITKAAAEHLPPGASIINTASVQAYKPGEALLDYASTKATIVAFTKSLSQQMIKKRRARQRRGAGSVLDRPAAQRRPDPGEGAEVRRRGRHGPSRPAGGAGAGVRAAGLAGSELHHRRGLLGDGWVGGGGLTFSGGAASSFDKLRMRPTPAVNANMGLSGRGHAGR